MPVRRARSSSLPGGSPAGTPWCSSMCAAMASLDGAVHVPLDERADRANRPAL
jgi:hypothetical protein